MRLVLREAVTLRNLKSPWRLRLMRWLYPQADAVVVLTEVMRQEMISVIGVSSSRLVCIPNPVDMDFIRSQAAIELDHHWFAPGSPPVIIGIGRLSLQKDFATLIRAFAELRSRRVEARLVILGEGPLRNELEDLVRKLQIENDVLMPGFDVNPYRWLARSQVFVLSSLWEGYPNVVLDALALEKPVVVTNYDLSVADLSKTGGSRVIVVPPASSIALSAAINWHFENISDGQAITMSSCVEMESYEYFLLNRGN